VLEEPSYRVTASLDERLLGKVKRGTPVEVDLPAEGGQKTLPITQVTPGIDPITRTFNVRIDLPYSAGLQSGLYVKLHVPYGEKSAVMAPKAAIGRRGQLQFAYVVGPNGILQLRALRTGHEYDGYVEVLSGLNPGDRVTVSGFEGLSEGDIVKEAKAR
jgi:multidrug efflux pump subunit AcrA (membrane-fusion protein)